MMASLPPNPTSPLAKARPGVNLARSCFDVLSSDRIGSDQWTMNADRGKGTEHDCAEHLSKSPVIDSTNAVWWWTIQCRLVGPESPSLESVRQATRASDEPISV